MRKLAASCSNAYDFVRTYGQHLPLAFEAIFSLPCKVTKIRGEMRAHQGELTVVFASRPDRNLPYLVDLLFDDFITLQEIPTTLFSFRKHMHRLSGDADVVIADIGWPYHYLLNKGGEFAEVPDWINMSIELGGEWAEVIRRFRQTTRNNDLRLIRRNGYRYVTTSDERAIADFYDRQYLPFVAHQHQAATVTASRKHVLSRARAGALLQVLRDDEPVAAGVIYPENRTLYFLWMGVPEKFVANPPEGAISALYYFGIQFAFEQRYEIVDFTGTRAFLKDGAFRFKRKWGATVDDTFSPSSILVKVQRGSPGAAAFCQQNPLLVRRDGGLEALFLVIGERVDADKFEQLARQFGCDGIDRITVVEISGENTTQSLAPAAAGCQYRHIRTRLDSLAGHYARRPAV